MRASIWVAGGFLAACLASPASAQFMMNTNNVSQTATAAAVPGQNSVGITEHIVNHLPFKELFRPIVFSSKVNAGTVNVGATTVIPDPNTPDYMAAFGYKRLTMLPPRHWWLWWDTN
jgi:hypothetical protein